MALIPVKQPVRTSSSSGKKSGSNLGGLLGAGLAAGAVAATGGGAAAALGAAGGAAGLGSLLGGAIQPGKQGGVTQEMLAGVPTINMAQGSQTLLDGIRELNNFPSLAQKYSQPLTAAYIQSQMELKRRSV